ncbi:hypothetical protein MASR2M79_05990 [Aminivibrio sp.]
MDNRETIRPFKFMECSLLPLSTGIRVQTLRELRAALPSVPLSAINPVTTDLGEIRSLLEDILDGRLEEDGFMSWKKSDREFYFIACKKLMFDTGRETDFLRNFPLAVKTASRESFFHHFLDARRRSSEGKDDFSLWLEQFGSETEAVRRRLEKAP